MEPDIAVLMSCFNAEQWLAESIESVLTQTHQNFEFIIVDDGSRDSTATIIRDYAIQDRRIKPIFKQNTGLPDSLNVGLVQAKAPWIARLDADDLAEPTRFAEQLEFVQNHPKVVLLGTGFTEIDSDGHLIKVHQIPTTDQQIKYNLIWGLRYIIHPSTLYSTASARRAGGYRSRAGLAEDLDLWLRLSDQEFACINKPLIRYRNHINQISRHRSEIAPQNLIDGCAVLICHFLRQCSSPDPIDFENEADWFHFREWVEIQIKKNQVLEYLNAWAKAKKDFFEQDNQVLGSLIALKQLLNSGHAASLIKLKLLGFNLPKCLAQKWGKDISVIHINNPFNVA
jgi:glycosyltransferase involved in cell wall biosynthesis